MKPRTITRRAALAATAAALAGTLVSAPRHRRHAPHGGRRQDRGDPLVQRHGGRDQGPGGGARLGRLDGRPDERRPGPPGAGRRGPHRAGRRRDRGRAERCRGAGAGARQGARAGHPRHHPRVARPAERGLELRARLLDRVRRSAREDARRQDGRRGQVRGLRRVADRTPPQRVGGCGDRVARREPSRHGQGRGPLRGRRERGRLPLDRPRPHARPSRPRRLPRVRQPGADRRRAGGAGAPQDRRGARPRAVLAGTGAPARA